MKRSFIIALALVSSLVANRGLLAQDILPATPPPADPAAASTASDAAASPGDNLGLQLEPAPNGALPADGRFRGGMLVKEAGDPAAKSGIQSGDILVGLGTYETTKAADVAYALAHSEKPLPFYIVREGATLSGQLGEGLRVPMSSVPEGPIEPPLVAAAPANDPAAVPPARLRVAEGDNQTSSLLENLRREGLIDKVKAGVGDDVTIGIQFTADARNHHQFEELLRNVAKATDRPIGVTIQPQALRERSDGILIWSRRTTPPDVLRRILEALKTQNEDPVLLAIEPKASLLVLKSDWSTSSANDIAGELKDFVKDLKLSEDARNNLPATVSQVLFPGDKTVMFTKAHAAELFNWLKDREVTVESTEFESTGPRGAFGVPFLKLTKPGDFLGTASSAVDNEAFVERRQEWQWNIQWGTLLGISRSRTQVEQWRGESQPRSPDILSSTAILTSIPEGYVGLFPAFAENAAGRYESTARVDHGLALIVIENDSLETLAQAQDSAAATPRLHLPDRVDQLQVENEISYPARRSRGFGGFGGSSSFGRGGFGGDSSDPRARGGSRGAGPRGGGGTSPPPASEPAASDPEFKVFSLKNANAEDTAAMLRQLLGTKSVSIAADARTNSLVVEGQADTLAVIEAIIMRLDATETPAPTGKGDPASGTSGVPVLKDTPVLGLAFQLDGDIRVLKQAYADREAEAAKLAKQIREADPQTPQGELQKLREQLRAAVGRAFQQRQTLLATELQELQRRIQNVERTLKQRQQIEQEIVDRRVEDLLNPSLKWEAEPAGPSPASSRKLPDTDISTLPLLKTEPKYEMPVLKPDSKVESTSGSEQLAKLITDRAALVQQVGASHHEVKLIDAKIEALQGYLKPNPNVDTANEIDPFMRQVTPLLLEREDLLQTVGANHSKVKLLDAKIAALRKLLKSEQPAATTTRINGVWREFGKTDSYLAISHGRAGQFVEGKLTRTWRVDAIGVSSNQQFDFVSLEDQPSIKAQFSAQMFTGRPGLEFVTVDDKGLSTVLWEFQYSVVPDQWAEAIVTAVISPSAPSIARFPLNGVWEWRASQVSGAGGRAAAEERPTLMIHENLAAFCNGTEIQRRWRITTTGSGDGTAIEFTPLDNGAGMTGQVHGGEIQTSEADRKLERHFARTPTQIDVDWFLAQFEGFNAAAKPAAPGSKISLNFQNAPWLDALTLLAESANLSLDLRETPPGTLTYQDQKEYTPAEAIDVLNGLLQPRDFALIARNDSLVCVAIGSELSDDLVPGVAVEALPERGKNEFVTVQVRFDPGTDVDVIKGDVEKVLGRHSSVRTLATTNALILTGPAGDLLRVLGQINTAPGRFSASAGANPFIRTAGPKQPSDYLFLVQSTRKAIRGAQMLADRFAEGHPFKAHYVEQVKELNAQLDLLQAEYENQLKTGAAELSAALAELESAQENRERTEALYKSAAISQSEVISAKERQTKARASFEKAEAVQNLFLDGQAKLFPEPAEPAATDGAALPAPRGKPRLGQVSEVIDAQTLLLTFDETRPVRVGEQFHLMRPLEVTDPSGGKHLEPVRIAVVEVVEIVAAQKVRTRVNSQKAAQTLQVGDIVTSPDADQPPAAELPTPRSS